MEPQTNLVIGASRGIGRELEIRSSPQPDRYATVNNGRTPLGTVLGCDHDASDAVTNA
ncbi:hypothetical protein BO71DRAFT_430347 [Aspergillus ellipticus CBS 707.79]|uniref:Uncharacterized protein n=1 Tax=Aspergillus ellipticus CBS 707.79 TaxID=1448320 RepID=A0A319DA52_9EURO|nr:hypothetical protein BO71DRAFT_430347 [Aspergillus ellipticus CBS 707.79]